MHQSLALVVTDAEMLMAHRARDRQTTQLLQDGHQLKLPHRVHYM